MHFSSMSFMLLTIDAGRLQVGERLDSVKFKMDEGMLGSLPT